MKTNFLRGFINTGTFRSWSVIGLLGIPVVLSGCSFGSKPGASPVDPPPASVEAAMLQAVQASAPAADGELSSVFLQDENGRLAPVSLPIGSGDSTADAKTALESLVLGGPFSGLLPEGFQGVLPQGTAINKVTLDKEKKTASIDFSGAFTKYQAKDERKILEALTWTLTGNPDIQNVQLSVDGQKLTAMPQGGIPVDRPLNRSLGINLEIGNGVSVTASRPVTVYFTAASPGGVTYYVPVTRLVNDRTDRMEAALQELIQGPQQEDGLNMVMTDGTTLESVKQSEDGVVTVSLKDSMFDKGQKIPEEFLQSVVLTAADNSGNARTAKVKIELNGEQTVLGESNEDYGKPVAKPEHLNEIPL
ncbi:GerMN domain-containing protein [Paenibacillus sp. JX-17]|uniref:GerMN domain-containing protein n=1 Tax=Paenibacillus lacisoli TaxID=3064525 RepID=A0ABT9CGY9_9BACL|nr:GerMN domain-containing protein [Paenibacillus sp. JX-17]MDO7906926.1 GerMN domain-containing protein [Paenibacillus sp. JX-17]